MRMAYLAAAVAASCVATFGVALAQAGGIGLGQQFPRVCAAGYYTDAGGNCQPNAGALNRYCPEGTVYEAMPYGWNCNPAPPGAYW